MRFLGLVLLILTVFQSLPAPAIAGQSQARSNLIVSMKSQSTSWGHWTLLKYKGQCRAITAFHVLGKDSQKIWMSFGEDKVSEVRVVKSDGLADLAEIEPISQVLNCTNLVDLSDRDYRWVKPKCGPSTCAPSSFVAESWLSGGPRIVTSLWWSSVETQESTPWKSLPFVYRLERFPMVAGMSGTAIEKVDQQAFLGICSEYIPLQDVAYVIPAEAIKEFLDSSENVLTERPTRMASVGVYSYRNKTDLARGGNSHDGGSGQIFKIAPGPSEASLLSQTLEVLRERPEGVVDPTDSSRIILGLNGMRVDGWDDYLTLRDSLAGKSLQLTTRSNESKSLPSIEVRRSVLPALLGSYMGRGEANLKLLTEDSGWIKNWSVHRRSPGDVYVTSAGDFRAASFEIQAVFPEESVFETVQPILLTRELNYKVELKANSDLSVYTAIVTREKKSSEISPKISLEKVFLECRNQHMQKLICTGLDQMELSLSLDSDRRNLRYRVTDVLRGQSPQKLIYLYGHLVRVQR